jgi:hypothetical protein
MQTQGLACRCLQGGGGGGRVGVGLGRAAGQVGRRLARRRTAAPARHRRPRCCPRPEVPVPGGTQRRVGLGQQAGRPAGRSGRTSEGAGRAAGGARGRAGRAGEGGAPSYLDREWKMIRPMLRLRPMPTASLATMIRYLLAGSLNSFACSDLCVCCVCVCARVCACVLCVLCAPAGGRSGQAVEANADQPACANERGTPARLGWRRPAGAPAVAASPEAAPRTPRTLGACSPAPPAAGG